MERLLSENIRQGIRPRGQGGARDEEGRNGLGYYSADASANRLNWLDWIADEELMD